MLFQEFLDTVHSISGKTFREYAIETKMTAETLIFSFEFMQAALGQSDPIFDNWMNSRSPGGTTFREHAASSGFSAESIIDGFEKGEALKQRGSFFQLPVKGPQKNL